MLFDPTLRGAQIVDASHQVVAGRGVESSSSRKSIILVYVHTIIQYERPHETTDICAIFRES